MPHADITPQEALDGIAASARELAAAYANLASFVKGAEAERVGRTLEFEVEQINANTSVLRKAFGDQRADDIREARIARGEPATPRVPQPVVSGNADA